LETIAQLQKTTINTCKQTAVVSKNLQQGNEKL
jgi:hypothetical protein